MSLILSVIIPTEEMKKLIIHNLYFIYLKSVEYDPLEIDDFFSCHDMIFKYMSSILRSCLTCRLIVGHCLETGCAIWKQFKLGGCQKLQKSCKYWNSPHFMTVKHIVLISKMFCYNMLSKLLFICVKRISYLWPEEMRKSF